MRRENIEICTTVYIIDKNYENMLFVKHKKLKKWVPPGGHIEFGELPEEAAIREVKEETGLNITLQGKRFPFEKGIIQPLGIQSNIDLGKQHIDIVYYAICNMENIQFNCDEIEDIRWFSKKEIFNQHFDSFTDTVEWCRKIFELEYK